MTDLVRTIREMLDDHNWSDVAADLLSRAADEIERLERVNVDLIKKVETWVAGCAIAEKETP